MYGTSIHPSEPLSQGEDEVSSMKNLVVFSFTEMGKTDEKTDLWGKLSSI